MGKSNSNPLTNERYFDEKAEEYGAKGRIVEPIKLVNPDTGDVYDAERVIKFTNHQNFVKCYIADLVHALSSISVKMDVVMFILDNTNYLTNQYLGSVRKTAELTGISYPTVQATFKLLEENNLIKKIATGVYMVNPSMLVKGSETKKHLLIDYYDADDAIKEIGNGNKKNNKG